MATERTSHDPAAPVRRAEDVLDAATEPEHPRKYATTDEPATHDDLVAEQRRETDEFGLFGTDAQRKGMVGGGLVGGLIGALVFAPFGLIAWGGAEVGIGLRLPTLAVIGFLVGSVIGAVYWGGRLPEMEGETTNADNSPGQGTTMADPRTDDRGRPLRP